MIFAKNQYTIFILISIFVILTISIIVVRYSQVVAPNGGREQSPNQRSFHKPEETVEAFLINFIASAPPESDAKALSKALSLLSDNVRKKLPPNPASGDLARFVGVQDVPDRKYVISKVIYKKNLVSDNEKTLAQVHVILKYSGADSEKLFQLSKTTDAWRIDGIN